MTFLLRHHYATATAVITMACLLGGCSSTPAGPGTADTAHVASLHSPADQATESSDVENQRPLINLDDTDEDVQALRKAWDNCVSAAGGPGYENPRMVHAQRSAKNDAILKKCRSKEPETFEERQLRTDRAAFLDNQHQWYLCAQQEGYALTTQDENGEFALTKVGPNGDFDSPKMDACRIKAFTH